MRFLGQLAALAGIVSGRQSPGTVVDESPLVVLYYENWAGWIRKFSPSHVEKNFLSRNMPVRNFVLNYAFMAWNYKECSLLVVDQIDLQKGDQGGWTPDDWTLDSTESWATSKPMGGHLPAFMMIRSLYPYIKLLPSVGGWSRSHTFHDCMVNKMDHMVQQTVDHVVVWGWDGIDLDWEYPNCDGSPCGCQGEATCTVESGYSNQSGPQDWDLYIKYVKAVRAKFDDLEDKLGRRLYITAAIGMNPKILDGHNSQSSVPTPLEWMCGEDDMDFINLMSYDFYGPWTPITGPLAPLYPHPTAGGIPDQMSIEDSMNRILKRCSRPEKLVMGLATYGKSWQQVPRTGEVPGLWQTTTSTGTIQAGGTWEMGTVSWFDIKHNILPQCQRTWDDHSKTPTIYCETLPLAPSIPTDPSGKTHVTRGQKNVFISYEDGESWKIKMAYARQKGMAGAIIWAASDTGCGESFAPDSTNDLMEALFEGWFGRKFTFAQSTSVAASPGTPAKWKEYPCPVNLDYSKGTTTVDTKRCDGLTYTPGSTYFVAPKSSRTSDMGKDKLLIIPRSGGGSSGGSSGAVTTTTTTTRRTTTTANRQTTAGKNCSCVCPNDTSTTTTRRPATTTTAATTRAPATTQSAAATTTRANVAPTPTQAPTGSGRTCPVKKNRSVGGRMQSAMSSDKLQMINNCENKIIATGSYAALCKKNCKTVAEQATCSAKSGHELAKCVAAQYDYCYAE